MNPKRLKAYHISSGGAVTQTPFTISQRGHNKWEVTLQVPGFSVYTLGDEFGYTPIPEVLPEGLMGDLMGEGGY